MPVTLLNPAYGDSTFSFSFQSQAGINYEAQYNGLLGTPDWTTLEAFSGDGTLKTITHTHPPAGTLVYRVMSELPQARADREV
jgi:hypothetical protein